MSEPVALTQLEYVTLVRIAEGARNAEIALIDNVACETVKNRVTTIMRKLRARNRTDAVVKALQSGILPLGGLTHSCSMCGVVHTGAQLEVSQ